MTVLKGTMKAGNSKTSGKLAIGRPLSEIEVSDIEGGHKIVVTDQSGTHELDVMDGKDGEPGPKGEAGITPHIGENGNWFIGETDTGVKAEAKTLVATDAVSTSDNGKFLQVVDGKPAWVAIDIAEEGSF